MVATWGDSACDSALGTQDFLSPSLRPGSVLPQTPGPCFQARAVGGFGRAPQGPREEAPCDGVGHLVTGQGPTLVAWLPLDIGLLGFPCYPQPHTRLALECLFKSGACRDPREPGGDGV